MKNGFQSVLNEARKVLLWGCTPDSILRLINTDLKIDAEKYTQIYFKSQCHESLCDFLQYRENHGKFGGRLIQVYRIILNICNMIVLRHSGIVKSILYSNGIFILLTDNDTLKAYLRGG